MLRMVLNISIAAKVISLLLLTVVLFSSVILLRFLPMVEQETFSDRKKGLKYIVEVSYSLLAEYEQRAGMGEFSREEAQERAMARIRQMRYGDNDYLWINDDSLPFPKMIMHPTKPELDGRILDDPLFDCAALMEFGENGRVQDIPGRDKNLFQAFVEVVAQTGEGFVVYDWPRPTREGVTQELYSKQSYVRLFQPWGWVIGTGVYVDDIAAQTARMRMTVISVTSMILAAVMLVAVFFIASIQRPMKALMGYAEKVTQGDLDFETSGRFYGETDQLKQTITTMVGRLKQTIRAMEIKSREAEHAASELQKSNKLYDAKNKELEQLVFVASHDLRSPLVNVDGFSRELDFSLKEFTAVLDGGKGLEELEKSLRTELPDMEKSIARIRASARQMDNLLKGLLKLSRSGRTALQIADIDMNECIRQLGSSLAYTLQETGTELTVEDLPACRGDSVQVTQVFSNLIDNAVKYRDPDRPLKIQIRGAMEADRAVYRVEDNGMGIAENHLEHVFELFHRLEPEKTKGEGLGLTIARQALSRMHGEIRVESQPGKGSVFTVSMPPAQKNGV